MPRYHTPKEYLDAARSPATSPAELRALAKAPYSFVLTAVARNPHTESSVLTTLIPTVIKSWNDQELAAAIACHPHTTADALATLARRLIPMLDNGRGHQVGFKAGVLLCCNPMTPIHAIATLLHSEHVAMQFRKVVARETRRQDVLAILLADRSETVRRQAQKTMQALDTGVEH